MDNFAQVIALSFSIGQKKNTICRGIGDLLTRDLCKKP